MVKYESTTFWVYTGLSGVYVLQVRTKARYVRTANWSWREAGMPLQSQGLHSLLECTGAWLEPGSTQPLGVYGLKKKKKKTKKRNKEQTSAQASSESGNGEKNKQTKKRNQHTGEATSLLTDAGTILDIGAVDLKWAM